MIIKSYDPEKIRIKLDSNIEEQLIASIPGSEIFVIPSSVKSETLEIKKWLGSEGTEEVLEPQTPGSEEDPNSTKTEEVKDENLTEVIVGPSDPAEEIGDDKNPNLVNQEVDSPFDPETMINDDELVILNEKMMDTLAKNQKKLVTTDEKLSSVLHSLEWNQVYFEDCKAKLINNGWDFK
jgi:hypothetical protein